MFEGRIILRPKASVSHLHRVLTLWEWNKLTNSDCRATFGYNVALCVSLSRLTFVFSARQRASAAFWGGEFAKLVFQSLSPYVWVRLSLTKALDSFCRTVQWRPAPLPARVAPASPRPDPGLLFLRPFRSSAPARLRKTPTSCRIDANRGKDSFAFQRCKASAKRRTSGFHSGNY